MTRPSCYVHATALVVGTDGVLIRGRSGAGKSALALALLRTAGLFVRLVGDDRVALSVVGGRLIARPHPAIAGQIERRGAGIETVAHEAASVIRFIIDFVAAQDFARLPDLAGRQTTIEGVILPCLRLTERAPSADAAASVLHWMTRAKTDA